MKRPATRTLILGHPIVAAPVTLAAGCGLYGAYEATSVGVGLLCAVMLAGTGQAVQEAQAYRAWNKMWAAASDDAAPRAPLRLKHAALLAATIALGIGYVLHPRELRASAPGIGVLTAVACACAVAWRMVRWTVRRLWRPTPKKAFAVSIVVRRTATVPTLVSAYRALPPHCAAILMRRQ